MTALVERNAATMQNLPSRRTLQAKTNNPAASPLSAAAAIVAYTGE